MTVISLFSLDGQTEGATPILPSGYAVNGSGAAFESRAAEKFSEDFGMLLPASASSYRRLEYTFGDGALTAGTRWASVAVTPKAFGTSATYFFSMLDGTVGKFDLRWNTAGAARTFTIRNIANANALSAGTSTYAVGTKYRFEIGVTIGGNIAVNTYLWDTATLIETVAIAATSITQLTKFYIGMTAFVALYSAAYGDIRYADSAPGQWAPTPPPVFFTYPVVYPLYIAHRGGMPGPEEVMFSYEQAYARSASLAHEMDFQILSDTTTVVGCHDTTITRTADASSPFTTGNVNSFTPAQWATIRFKPESGTDTWRLAATLADYAAAFGSLQSRSVLFTPEIKAGLGATQPINEIKRLNLADRSIVQSFTLAYVQAAAAAGLEACYIATAVPVWATIKGYGINHVCMNKTIWTGTDITNAHAAGLKCWAFTVNTVAERDSWLALGMDAFFTDYPELLSPTVVNNQRNCVAAY